MQNAELECKIVHRVNRHIKLRGCSIKRVDNFTIIILKYGVNYMSKENKFLLVLQIIITIVISILLINQPEKLDLINLNTGEKMDVFTSIIFFVFILWLFGAIWGAGLFVIVVEGYTLLKALFYSITKKEKKVENEMDHFWGKQMLFSLILGYVSSFIVLITKI